MSDHLGYDKHAVEGRNRENSLNGKRFKTIVTEAAGEVQIVTHPQSVLPLSVLEAV